jgi:hypothetical protein
MFNYSITKSIIYRDLNFINSLFIKKINYFAFKFSPFIKNYSLEDFIVINRATVLASLFKTALALT